MWRKPARMRSRPVKPHTSARRALPLVRVSYPLRLLFNAVDVPLHDDCRLRDFLALLELPALLPNLLIDLRKLFIEIRFFCQQGFAWNAASIQDLFCIVIFCFSRRRWSSAAFTLSSIFAPPFVSVCICYVPIIMFPFVYVKRFSLFPVYICIYFRYTCFSERRCT